MVFVSSIDSRFKNLKEIEKAIKNKDVILFAEGSPTQKLSIKKFIDDVSSDNKTVLVSYNGTNPIVKDIVGKHIDIAFLPLSTVQGLIDAGKIKVLGITGNKFSLNFPEATFISKEYPSFKNFAGFSINVSTNLDKKSKLFWEDFFRDYLKDSQVDQETAKMFSEPFEFGKSSIDILVESMIKQLQ
jgi:tripartite-type tricarboxylate transporter receptor subunit TctC